MNRLTRADLPTRTSPTRTTLHSCLTWVKRCLTLPILGKGIWSTLEEFFNKTAKFRDFTSQSLNNYWVPWCRQSSVIQGRCTAESVQFGVGLPPSTLARGWRSGLLSSRDRPSSVRRTGVCGNSLLHCCCQLKTELQQCQYTSLYSKECQRMIRCTFGVSNVQNFYSYNFSFGIGYRFLEITSDILMILAMPCDQL